MNIVILTGAGISAESGIATFRDSGGLWENHKIEDVATPEGFRKNPALVHKFYNLRRQNLAAVEPNEAHFALARLEKELKGKVHVVTQNVDDLHERAGSEKLIHMHGELLKMRCTACDNVISSNEDFNTDSICPKCERTGTLRPDIVWFGEMPMQMKEIGRLLHVCDLFISVGTSGNVYPAAGFVQQVVSVGKAHTVELNLEKSQGASFFEEGIYGKASEIVPAYVEQILRKQ
jgi:NAD-dependent deacetylase